jgi:CRISPR-associated endonuclease Cas2
VENEILLIMRIKKESLTSKIFKTIKFIIDEAGDIAYDLGPSFGALLSRKTLGEVLSAMPGYKSNLANFGRNYSASLGRLKNDGFIKFSDRDRFVLTDKGQGVLLKFDIDGLKLPDFDSQKWDGIWRVLIFDIPELTRAVRNLFRNKIQELGFYTLQKSVYVTPLACEKEIDELTRLLRIGNGVDVIHSSKLGRKELAVRRFFGISLSY